MPHWFRHGIDWARGGFAECLTLSGEADDPGFKRLRVQARQIYVFSHAALTDPDRARRAQWAHAAGHGFDFMVRHYWQGASRGWARAVTPEGKPFDASAEFYDQTFVLLACAWYYRALGWAGALADAAKTLDFLDRHLADTQNGGYLQGLTETGEVAQEAPRQQNPHMHLLEALLALYKATGEKTHLARGAAVLDLFRTRFFDAGANTLGEYFTGDWLPLPGSQGEIVEPGHHFEWVWLLYDYAGSAGDASAAEYAQRAFAFALEHGVDPKTGLAYDAIDRRGARQRPGHRLWPQTEMLKALIASAEHAPEKYLRENAQKRIPSTIAAIFDNYLGAGGIWRDQLDAGLASVSQSVPATSLYHLFVAFSETLRFYEANKSI